MTNVRGKKLNDYDGVCAMIGRAVVELGDMRDQISKEMIIDSMEKMREGIADEGGSYPKYLEMAITRLKE